MTKKLLPLLLLSALSAAAHAATPPNTLVVAQGLDEYLTTLPQQWRLFPQLLPDRS